MEIRFGDVVWVDFGENSIGSVQKGKRPAVVIQNDIGNKFSPTSIVVPITSAIKKLNMPCHKLLRCTKENGLTEDSMVLGEQVQVVSKTDIISKLGTCTGCVFFECSKKFESEGVVWKSIELSRRTS